MAKVTINRLRTGHISINAHLFHIRKKDSRIYECRAGEQTQKHVIIRCGFGDRNKSMPWDEIIKDALREDLTLKNLTLKNLLFSKRGVAWAMKIWAEFVKERGWEVKSNREMEWG